MDYNVLFVWDDSDYLKRSILLSILIPIYFPVQGPTL